MNEANVQSSPSSDSPGRAPDVLLANLSYLKPDPRYDEEKPYSIAGRLPDGQQSLGSNIEYVECTTSIANARGRESNFSLRKNGFEWAHHRMCCDVHNDTGLEQYLKEMPAFLMAHFGARRVHIYDYVRRYSRKRGESRPPGMGKDVLRPNNNCHTDIGPGAGGARLRQMLPDEADVLLQRPFQIIGCWRPIVEPVQDYPLAVCDFVSLEEDDLVPADLVLPHHVVETSVLWYNPKQKWHYLRHQMKDEILLIKSYDSESPVQCVHSAFLDSTCGEDASRRESIELRCFVFY